MQCFSASLVAKLLHTPFRHVVVPPPMSAHELAFSTNIILITYAPPSLINQLLVVLANGMIAFVRPGDVVGKNEKEGFRKVTRAPQMVSQVR